MEAASQKFIFSITGPMINAFTELTGDKSSLHTDARFSRRMPFRGPVVHGMLPVIFISGAVCCGRHHRLGRLAARFIKPVQIDEKLELKVRRAGEEFEFTISRVSSGAVVTTGIFLLLHEEERKKSVESGGQHCLLDKNIQESQLTFKEIAKGLSAGFTFKVAARHFRVFSSLLSEGGFGEGSALNPAELMAASLLSTYVGMFMPGRYATFVDFNLFFKEPIKLDTEYRLDGIVEFVSESTRMLTQTIWIKDPAAGSEEIAMGKLGVKVNEMPARMPASADLKKDSLALGLKGKVIIVTGASRGLGETIAKLLSLHGAKVVVNYSQSAEDAASVVKDIGSAGGEAVALQADVTDRSQVRRLIQQTIERYGSVDGLINNAVRDAGPIPWTELTWEDIQRDIDVNLKGAFYCCQEAGSAMIRQKSGKIVNVSTIFTDSPPEGQMKYVISKSGLTGLTRSLAVELAPFNVQVNMVVPSLVETDLSRGVPEIFLKKFKADTPMKRLAEPAEVAKAVVFLCSSLSSFTTGQRIMVTGGASPLL